MFTVTKHKSGTTLAAVAFGTRPGKTPRVTLLDATSDKATSDVDARVGTVQQATSAAAAGAQADITLADATGLAPGDGVVIEPADGSEPFTGGVIGVSSQVVTLAANLPGALPKNSLVTKLETRGSIALGAATKQWGLGHKDSAVFAGAAGRPLVIEADGTSAVSINTATALYD